MSDVLRNVWEIRGEESLAEWSEKAFQSCESRCALGWIGPRMRARWEEACPEAEGPFQRRAGQRECGSRLGSDPGGRMQRVLHARVTRLKDDDQQSFFPGRGGKPKKLFGVPYFVHVMHDKMGEDPDTPSHRK